MLAKPRIQLASRLRLAAAVAALTVGAWSLPVLAHGMLPESVPVERILANMESFIKEHPGDADGYYRLGRVHLLALETKTGFVPMWMHENPPAPTEGAWSHNRGAPPAKGAKTVPEAELIKHLTDAIKNLNIAIELKPEVARYHLTLASTLEAGASFKSKARLHPRFPVSGAAKSATEWQRELVRKFTSGQSDINSVIERISQECVPCEFSNRDVVLSLLAEAGNAKDVKPEVTERIRQVLAIDWDLQTVSEYFLAMTQGLPKDGMASERPIWGGLADYVSYESAQGLVRVVTARGPRPEDHVRLAVAKATIQGFDTLPEPNAITPIVMSLASAQSLEHLLDPQRQTTFDLDGTARPQRWPWLAPQTGLLCWDPAHAGKITSGRQLFGSVTWWLFFEDGYQALDALDDNRDGQLAGAELDGLSLWFDRNGDGVSDPGEVIPVADLGIAAISCRQTSVSDACPANLQGLTMSDGRVLPTYDWIAHPAPATPAAQPLSTAPPHPLPLPAFSASTSSSAIPSSSSPSSPSR